MHALSTFIPLPLLWKIVVGKSLCFAFLNSDFTSGHLPEVGLSSVSRCSENGLHPLEASSREAEAADCKLPFYWVESCPYSAAFSSLDHVDSPLCGSFMLEKHQRCFPSFLFCLFDTGSHCAAQPDLALTR